MIIDFNITNYCNAKCPTCKRFDAVNYLEVDKNLDVSHMEYKKFEEVVKKNKKFFEYKTCYFCGEFGDPLMHPQIKDFAELAADHFASLTVYTNGGLKRDEFFKYVAETKNKISVRFGIDGLTHEINNLYRINVKTDLAYENMFMLAKHGKARWDYTIFEHNKHEVEDVVKLALEKNIKLMIRCNLRPSKFGINRITKDDYEKFIQIAKKYEKEDIEFDKFWIN